MSLPGQVVCDRSMRSLPAANPLDRYGDALGRVDLSPPLLLLPGEARIHSARFTSRLVFGYFMFYFYFLFDIFALLWRE